MYEDDSMWKAHYNDWCGIMKTLKVPKKDDSFKPTIEQIESRIRTINALIIDYEVDHNANHERGL
jgi:hypothetical protein